MKSDERIKRVSYETAGRECEYGLSHKNHVETFDINEKSVEQIYWHHERESIIVHESRLMDNIREIPWHRVLEIDYMTAEQKMRKKRECPKCAEITRGDQTEFKEHLDSCFS